MHDAQAHLAHRVRCPGTIWDYRDREKSNEKEGKVVPVRDLELVPALLLRLDPLRVDLVNLERLPMSRISIVLLKGQ